MIVPTWRRHNNLLERCIPSVLDQDYRPLELVVVSDGPDPELATIMRDRFLRPDAPGVSVKFFQLRDHDPAIRWGVRARIRGADLASGQYFAWLDDDNAYRSDHVSRLAELLDTTDAGFAYSVMQFHTANGHEYLVGALPPMYGGIDTSAIMHRREILRTGNWRDTGPEQSNIDWDLVERWMAAGVKFARDDRITADYYFPLAEPRLVDGVKVLGGPMAGEPWSFTAHGHTDDFEALMEALGMAVADHRPQSTQFTHDKHNGPLPKKAHKASKSDDAKH